MLGLAEEIAGDAFLMALERWPRDGIPRNPAAWLTEVARNRALDRLRRTTMIDGKHREIAVDLAELEHHATALTSFQVVHIPGLLQTEAYARSMYAHAMSDMDPDELRAATSFRVQRRRILDREQPPALDVVIHEAALRIRIGDREVEREQLGFILEMAAHPAVSVRVIPFERDGFSGSGFSMLYLDGPVRKLDTAQFDTAHGSLFVDAETELAGYRAFLGRVRDLSLPEAASMDLIHRIARQL